ncbi:MAG: hypothetical protein QF541_03225, partial [Lentisphaeria bacterium]|nr:hypothetical protein [Lentisphaeria bacterium]
MRISDKRNQALSQGVAGFESRQVAAGEFDKLAIRQFAGGGTSGADGTDAVVDSMEPQHGTPHIPDRIRE